MKHKPLGMNLQSSLLPHLVFYLFNMTNDKLKPVFIVLVYLFVIKISNYSVD